MTDFKSKLEAAAQSHIDGIKYYSLSTKPAFIAGAHFGYTEGHREALAGASEVLKRVKHAIANAWEWQISDPEDSEMDRDQQIGSWCEKACDEINQALADWAKLQEGEG